MKKLIGVLAILITLLLCIIYRHLTNAHVKSRPVACRFEPLRAGLFFTALLMH
jgi:hypothetical protein